MNTHELSLTEKALDLYKMKKKKPGFFKTPAPKRPVGRPMKKETALKILRQGRAAINAPEQMQLLARQLTGGGQGMKLKEFRYEPPTPQEERQALLKTGLLAGGLVGAGGLAGLGLYKAGVSNFARKAARLAQVVRNVSANKAAGVRKAKATAAVAADSAAKQQASYSKAAQNFYGKGQEKHISAAIKAQTAKSKAAKAAAKAQAEAAKAAAAKASAGPTKTTVPEDVFTKAAEANPAPAPAKKYESWAKARGAFKRGEITEEQFKAMKFSARLSGLREFAEGKFVNDEGGIPFTGKVAKDRFIKKIRDEDLDRRDANILRAGAAGAMAGLLLKAPLSAGKRALIGAGLGGAGVIGTRLLTERTRDVYGERSRGAKRAEMVPSVLGLGLAGYLAARRLGFKGFRGRGTPPTPPPSSPAAAPAPKSKARAKVPAPASPAPTGVPFGAQAKKWAKNLAGLKRDPSYLAAKLRGLKEFDDYKLYYFRGRNTGIAARSAEEARKKKKRGGDELVAVRTPNATEKSQMARGIWVRTRRDGKSPEKSRYGKGRGQGPARKSMGAKLRGMKEFGSMGLQKLYRKRAAIVREGLMTRGRGVDGTLGAATSKLVEQHPRLEWKRGAAIDRWLKSRNSPPMPAGEMPSILLSARHRAVKFFEKKKEKKTGGMNPYVGAALSGGASGALLGGLSILRRGVKPMSALGTAAKLGAVSAGIVGGGALLGSKIIGAPREDEGAPFTKRAALGGALAGIGAGSAGGLLLRKTRGGARLLVGASKNWRPAQWIRKSPLAAGVSLGGVSGGLYGLAQGLDEGQQVDSIRNLRKDVGLSRRIPRVKEFQVSPLPNVEPMEVTRKRRNEERANFLRTVGTVAAVGLAGIGGYKVARGFGKAELNAAKRAARQATDEADLAKVRAERYRREAMNARSDAARSRAGESSGGSTGGFNWEDFFRRAEGGSARSSRGYDSDYARKSAEAKAKWNRDNQGSSSSSGSSKSSGASKDYSPPPRSNARGEANPYAGTDKAQKWEQYQSMQRMARESVHEGERAAAAAAAEKWKRRYNLARKLRGLKMFGRADQPRDPVTKRYKDPLWSWASGEKLIKINPDGTQSAWSPSSPQLVNSAMAHAARARVPVQRTGRMTKDVSDVLQGKERERDASGRIKKREWEKSWFQNYIAQGALAAGALGTAFLWRRGMKNPNSRLGKVVGNVNSGIKRTKEDMRKAAGDFMNSAGAWTDKQQPFIKLSARPKRLKQFDAYAESAGWDVRDPRGRSARVFAPGSRRRERREKAWHERAENERKLWMAGLAGTALVGGAGAIAAVRLAKGKSLVPSWMMKKKAAMPEAPGVARRADGKFAPNAVDPTGGKVPPGQTQSDETKRKLRDFFASGGTNAALLGGVTGGVGVGAGIHFKNRKQKP